MPPENLDLQRLEHALKASCAAVSSPNDLTVLKRDWLGKEGTLKVWFQKLRELAPEEKPRVAAKLNTLKSGLEDFIAGKGSELAAADRSKKLSGEFLDLSLPAQSTGVGRVHPVRLVERKIEAVLKPFGFRVVEGPEIETEYYCFDALNIPKHHPARDMQDTFYTTTGHVLRTHTTSVQARELEKGELPVKIISCGRVYRNETEDTSHQAMFRQYELVWIDEGLVLAHLMGVLKAVLKGLYGSRRKVRFIPKFYPYTEPSIGAQIDCTLCHGKGCAACEGAGWATIVGAGMVHRNVLTEFNYDPEEVSGIAFGFGTDRLAAQFYNAPNLKTLYENDLRMLRGLTCS